VKSIAQSVDLMLCLLPFEARFYDGHGVAARYIGHPLAETLAQPIEQRAARTQLGLAAEGPLVAILPGSRGGELKYLAVPFAQAAAWLSQRLPEVSFVTPLAKPALRAPLEAAIATHAPDVRWSLVDGQSREAMRAADGVLLASGTATLECLLLDRPMVVAYRMAALTAWIARRLVKSGHFALPNLLCAEAVVPEFFQEEGPPVVLGQALLQLLTQPIARSRQLDQFDTVRRELKRDAAAHAAMAIAELLAQGGRS
jgi:lipid-A-disaccharide synthase